MVSCWLCSISRTLRHHLDSHTEVWPRFKLALVFPDKSSASLSSQMMKQNWSDMTGQLLFVTVLYLLASLSRQVMLAITLIFHLTFLQIRASWTARTFLHHDWCAVQVKSSRQRSDILDQVFKKFEEELAARQTTGTLLQFERWNEDGVKGLGALHDWPWLMNRSW